MVLEMFLNQISFDREVETSKIDLALKSDFDLMDASRVFDPKGQGWIGFEEWMLGLRRLGVGGGDGGRLVFDLFDRGRGGKMRYSDFVDSFAPKTKEY